MPGQKSSSDVLIRGGTVIDGTGAPGRPGDVRVRGGVIVEVGPGLVSQGEPEIDATGAVVTPGFIESHAHVDPSVFWDPLVDPSPQHGVTTMLAGNCSLSLFPIRPEMKADAIALFSLIEDMPPEALTLGVPWNWTGYDGYRRAVDAQGLGLNLAVMVGHSLLRWFVMGDAAWERVATAEEIAELCRVLDENIRAGAFGLSTSFGDKDHLGRWVPSVHADDAEFGALIDVLAEHGGILEFVPNLSGGTAFEDIDRMGGLCGPRGVTCTWNTLGQSKRAPERAGQFLAQAARQQAAGIKIYPQGSPRTFDLRINWYRSVLFNEMTTSWGPMIKAEGEPKLAMLQDPEWRARARADWDATKLSPFPTWDISRLRLITVTRPENEEWVGKTLADLVAARGGHPSDVLADWLVQNDVDPGVVAVGVTNDDPVGVGEILCNPTTIVGGSDVGAHVAMFCAAGDTTLLLTRHVRERGDMTLEAAVHELTGRQASVLGFAGRGVVEVGAVADLLVFSLDELKWDPDVFVADLPGCGSRLRRPEGGYRYTIVAGEVVQAAGKLTGARPGHTLTLASVES
jgi:N-acyl-D-aspartate/D-glutamate deacylase